MATPVDTKFCFDATKASVKDMPLMVHEDNDPTKPYKFIVTDCKKYNTMRIGLAASVVGSAALGIALIIMGLKMHKSK